MISMLALEIGWKGDDTMLYLVPPAGHHVATDAPVDIAVSWTDHTLAVGVPGAEGALGFELPDLRGQTVTGEVSASVCDDAGTLCKRVTVGFYGAVPSSKKGRVPLLATTPAKPAPENSPAEEAFHRDSNPSRTADAAFAKAAAADALVLLEFGAVWCPPCNQLAAEVLHAPDADDVLKGYVVVTVDADDPGSWALKDRYAVTGYPTILATDATGAELGRLLGYDSRDRFVAWLDENRAGGLAAKLARDPSTVAPEDAAAVALELVRLDRDATVWLARAAAAPETALFRRARLASAPTAEDARWLAEHGVPASQWAHDALDLAEADVALAATLRVAIARDLSGDVLTAVTRLEMLAEIAVDETTARALYGAAAAALQAWFTGDAARDRSQYTWFADLRESAGDVDGAVAFLDAQALAFPDEMTFSHAAGRMLTRAGRPAEALPRLEAAHAVAWGDNKLRTALARAEALVALGRHTEARALVDTVLAEFPEPPAGVEVRTSRYRAQIVKAVGDSPAVAAP